MKKLLIIFSVFLASCENYSENAALFYREIHNVPPKYEIKIIDGCEYVETKADNFERIEYSLVHKENCKNHGTIR